MRNTCILGVPSSAGARQLGQEQAPKALRQASYVRQLRNLGMTVTDLGDLPEVCFRPDKEHPWSQNLQLVTQVAGRVADQVRLLATGCNILVVLGRDCMVTLGVLAGLSSQTQKLGLIYLDGDLELNTPKTTISGVFDGMVLAHATGNGADELCRIAERYPLVLPENVVLFGYNTDGGGIDKFELQVLAESPMIKFPLAGIRLETEAAAEEALAMLEHRADCVLVHFDLDVIDFSVFPGADLPHYGGFTFDETTNVLGIFLSSSKLAGFVVTEFNARFDSDGTLARRLATCLTSAVHQHDCRNA